jgi:serine/threonine protein kinase
LQTQLNASPGLTRRDTEEALEMKPMADHGLLNKTEGTYAFWSPEMCDGTTKFSGYAADIWAAGVCLYILATGKLPFYKTSPIELLDEIKEANVPFDEMNLSHQLLDLLRITLTKDPKARAGVGDCLKHSFLVMARAKRIKQLSVELAQSRAQRVEVDETEIKSVRYNLRMRFVVSLLVLALYTVINAPVLPAKKHRLSVL